MFSPKTGKPTKHHNSFRYCELHHGAKNALAPRSVTALEQLPYNCFFKKSIFSPEALPMRKAKFILGISGSTRANSSNGWLLRAVQQKTSPDIAFHIFEGLDRLPHFNPDLDTDEPPASVHEFRSLVKAANGILICTPEYAMGVPGALKNALDWTVSSMDFSQKPTALITAASQGFNAHQSLLDTLTVIEARITAHSSLLISFAKTRISSSGITDPATDAAVDRVLEALLRLMEETTGFQDNSVPVPQRG